MSSNSNHVWRWRDEEPMAIIPLVLIICTILLVPWEGCNPLKSDHDARKNAASEAQSKATTTPTPATPPAATPTAPSAPEAHPHPH